MEFKCEYCGKQFTGGNPSLIYRFCSKSCAGKAKFEGDFDRSLDWKKEGDLWQCPYNEGVHCRSRRCDTCGWNPDVRNERNEKLREAMA